MVGDIFLIIVMVTMFVLFNILYEIICSELCVSNYVYIYIYICISINWSVACIISPDVMNENIDVHGLVLELMDFILSRNAVNMMLSIETFSPT